MLYFKHSELVNKYHVSLKTVHNWIDAAKQGKLSLELYEKGSRTYIANVQSNLTLLDKLSEDGKKYKNTRFNRVITPDKRLYSLYSRKQILDIINGLSIHAEIPRQYNYFEEGAISWDEYATKMWTDEGHNLIKSSADLLSANEGAIGQLIHGYKRVNVIDLGPGNALPVKGFLQYLLNKGVLHRYIAVDISSRMLDLAMSNVESWYGDSINAEAHLRDLSYEHFDDLVVDDMLDTESDSTINVALLLGATPMNFQNPEDPLRAIYKSLGQNDILIYTDKPDTEAERRYFDFNFKPGQTAVSPNHKLLLDLLNINESLYDVEMAYNDAEKYRYIQIRLRQAIEIEFTFDGAKKRVKFDKGSAIILWRVWHMPSLGIISSFEKVGFNLLQSSLTRDRQYLLTTFGL